MTIDSFIYVFLRDMPGLLFELIGEDPLLAQRYRFGSEELKEVSLPPDFPFARTSNS